MEAGFDSSQTLAASITRAASRQTYSTVRFLVDRELIPDAYRAYAYFRWLDDQLDQGEMEKSDRVTLVERQVALMNHCYQGMWPRDPTLEEHLLADLIRGDHEKNSGLQAYLRNMMAVMAFDAERRGRLISQVELAEYCRSLATAVTEALHYFIGHDCQPPRSDARYLAATAAHITHMLRDTRDDNATGYFNIPREFLEAHRITPYEVESDAYRAWVQSRVRLARAYFNAGKDYLARVENLRCRIAGYAYIARFEGVLEAIEREGYRLRSEYPECKSLGAGMRLSWSVLSLALKRRRSEVVSRALPAR
jgi:phytoene/squalene synthetase